jgi:beta-phosphoglucomutase-like phosphatase (HAD superfamily)
VDDDVRRRHLAADARIAPDHELPAAARLGAHGAHHLAVDAQPAGVQDVRNDE